MAESEQAQEKTEEATPRRKEQARKKGNVVRSKELNTALLTVSGIALLIVFSSSMYQTMLSIMTSSFKFDYKSIYDLKNTLIIFHQDLLQLVYLLAPYMLALMVIILLSPVALGGFSFSTSALAPKADRLNPAKGLKRIFSAKGLMELVKSVFKIALIGSVCYFIMSHQFDKLFSLSQMPILTAVSIGLEILGYSILAMTASLLLIAAVDVPFQLAQHAKEMKMSKQDVKDESKDTDGKPEVKSRIRAVQREVAQRRMMADIPTADVILTNPTHYSVALRYDEDKDNAPIVVGKGADLIAFQIRKIAKHHHIELIESPLLTRSIYYTADIGFSIPEPLYRAVAQILAYVYQLKDYRKGRGAMPKQLPELDIPDEYQHY